jgi:hypothetical protein
MNVRNISKKLMRKTYSKSVFFINWMTGVVEYLRPLKPRTTAFSDSEVFIFESNHSAENCPNFIPNILSKGDGLVLCSKFVKSTKCVLNIPSLSLV